MEEMQIVLDVREQNKRSFDARTSHLFSSHICLIDCVKSSRKIFSISSIQNDPYKGVAANLYFFTLVVTPTYFLRFDFNLFR